MYKIARLLVVCGFFLALLVPAAQAATAKAVPVKSAKKAQVVKKSVVARRGAGKRVVSHGARRKATPAAPKVAARPSFGELAGLHETSDAPDLKSSVAFVIDQDTREVLLRKNDQAVLPIASLTKLMSFEVYVHREGAFTVACPSQNVENREHADAGCCC